MLDSGIYVPTLGCHSKVHKPSEDRQLKRGAKLQSQVISEPCSLEEPMGGATLASSSFQQIKAIHGSLGQQLQLLTAFGQMVCALLCVSGHMTLSPVCPVCFWLLHCEDASGVGFLFFSSLHLQWPYLQTGSHLQTLERS